MQNQSPTNTLYSPPLWRGWGRVLLSPLSPLIQESEVSRDVARAHLP